MGLFVDFIELAGVISFGLFVSLIGFAVGALDGVALFGMAGGDFV